MTPVAEMTNTQIAETVIAKLRVQGSRCTMTTDDRGTFCVYRDPEGRGCAIGVLLPDHIARVADEVDDTSISSACVDVPALARFLGIELRYDDESDDYFASGNRLRFFVEVQGIHDEADNWNPWGMTLSAVAQMRYLAQMFDILGEQD